MSILRLGALWLAAGGISLSQARDFYVSKDGQDTSSGESPARAFRTLSPLRHISLQPGDRVLLEAGQSFSGHLYLTDKEAGDPLHPVVITTYPLEAKNWARLRPSTSSGIYVRNTSGVVISRLVIDGFNCPATRPVGGPVDFCQSPEFAGCGRTRGNGITIVSDRLPEANDDGPFAGITISDVVIRGFTAQPSDSQLRFGNGLVVVSDVEARGFKDLRVERVKAHDNGHTGILIDGGWRIPRTKVSQPARGLSNVVVRDCEAHHNAGVAGFDRHTGSGILLAGTDQGLIEHSSAHHNGCLNQSPALGPVGIWAFNVDRTTIQKNLSYSNRSGSGVDGDGFDLDGATTRSVMRDNFSFDNDGAGYFLAQWSDARAVSLHQGNRIEHNVSVNDGRTNAGGIALWGEIEDALVQENRVIVSDGFQGHRGVGLHLRDVKANHVQVTNNVFVLLQKSLILGVTGWPSGFDFRDNKFFRSHTRLQDPWAEGLVEDQVAQVLKDNAILSDGVPEGPPSLEGATRGYGPRTALAQSTLTPNALLNAK